MSQLISFAGGVILIVAVLTMVGARAPMRNCHMGLSNGHVTPICPEDPK